MLTDLELAQLIFQNKSDKIANNTTTQTFVSAGASSDGLVPVNIDGTIVDLATTISVQEGQEVLVSITNNVPTVTGVVGWGDVIVDSLDAAYAHIGNLEADFAMIGELYVGKAEIDELIANNATITNLRADFADIANAAIQNATITTAQISDLTAEVAKITNAQIQSATINSAQIADLQATVASITTAQIQNATITTAQITDLTTTVANIADAQIGNATIDFAQIGYSQIDDASITNLYAKTGLLTDVFIKDGNLTGTLNAANINVANLTVGDLNVTKLNGVTVPADKTKLEALLDSIANDLYGDNEISTKDTNGLVTHGINADRLTVGTLAADRIAANSISVTKLFISDDGSDTATLIVEGSVTAREIAANAITAEEIAAGTITVDELDVNSLETTFAVLGNTTIDATSVHAGKTSITDTSHKGYYISNNGEIRIGNAASGSSQPTNEIYFDIDGKLLISAANLAIGTKSVTALINENGESITANLESQIKSTADGLKVDISTLVNDSVEPMNTYFDFASDGLTIGKSSSLNKVRITNTDVQILDGTTTMATFSGDLLEVENIDATNAVIENASISNLTLVGGGEISFGRFKWDTSVSQHMSLVYV